MFPPSARRSLLILNRRRCALAAVMLVEVVLFTGYHVERWQKGLSRRNQPQIMRGEGLVIRSDGLGYYAWLRSLLIDGDWCFDNEFDEHNPLGDYVPPITGRTAEGRRSNPWSVGPACVWALSVVPGHALMKAFGDFCPGWPADGYSLPYQLLVGTTTLVASFFGLILLYGICRRFADRDRAALAAAFLTLGSTVVYYSSIEVSMAHGVGTAVLALLVWYWLKTLGSDGRLRWCLLGALVGASALMRWQLITLAVLPAGEALWACYRRSGPLQPQGWNTSWRFGACRVAGLCRPTALLALAALTAVVVLLPQLIAWRIVYGQWLASPFPTAQNWLRPACGQVLWSQDRGLFYWTPLTLLAGAGYLRLIGRSHNQSKANAPTGPLFFAGMLLGGAFLLQVYALASLWGEQLYLGAAYGFRQLTESTVVLAPGLALLLGRASKRVLGLLLVACTGLVAWNLLLICEYRYGLVPADAGADLTTILRNAVHLLEHKRMHLIPQVVLGPMCLAIICWKVPANRALAGRPDTTVPAAMVSLQARQCSSVGVNR
jgi:Dolichyl-phosphate-mannose-protein mannosyltransferase